MCCEFPVFVLLTTAADLPVLASAAVVYARSGVESINHRGWGFGRGAAGIDSACLFRCR